MIAFPSIQSLFISKTIPPTYKLPHVVYTIMILGQSSQGVGRYRIKKEIGLGEGSIKTLLIRLKDEEIISTESKRQMGHLLTPKGIQIFQTIIQMLPIPQSIENEQNKFVVGKFAMYTLIRKEYQRDYTQIGISQRDEAIKIGGTGATVLIYNNHEFMFPDNYSITIPEIHDQCDQGDLVVIGGGETDNQARLSAIAAALSLLKMDQE